MKGRGGLVVVVGGFLTITLLAVLFVAEPPAASSVLSRGARGWLAARRLLEAHGAETRIVDVPLEQHASEGGVLAIAFPWSGGLRPSREVLDRYLRRGGTLLVAYSGELRGTSEVAFFSDLDADLQAARPDPPRNPWAWRRYSQEEWTLAPDAALSGLHPARVSALRYVPAPPAATRVHHRNAEGLPIVFSFPRGKGQVFVMPAEMLANGRLAEAGNADWLATLAASLEGPWAFDEYHHGVVSATASPEQVQTGRFMDLYLLQVLFLYGLAVLALARRFGPPWRTPAVVSGSVAGFLVGLGAMHERSRHHEEAARALAERAARLDTRLNVPDVGAVTGPETFLALARRLGQLQWRARG